MTDPTRRARKTTEAEQALKQLWDDHPEALGDNFRLIDVGSFDAPHELSWAIMDFIRTSTRLGHVLICTPADGASLLMYHAPSPGVAAQQLQSAYTKAEKEDDDGMV